MERYGKSTGLSTLNAPEFAQLGGYVKGYGHNMSRQKQQANEVEMRLCNIVFLQSRYSLKI